MPEPHHRAFLSYSRLDGPSVARVAEQLEQRGVEVWLDEWNLIPGDRWQPEIAKQLQECRTCVLFVGTSGEGPWQHREMEAVLTLSTGRDALDKRLIPVLLPDTPPELTPLLLRAHTDVRMRSLDDADALDRLAAAIRGQPVRPRPAAEVPIADGRDSPYLGLSSFDVAHGPFFFGRRAVVHNCIERIQRDVQFGGPRILILTGASGSGKSSIARAGILYQLKEQSQKESPWLIGAFRPGGDPVRALADELYRISADGLAPLDIHETARKLRESEESLHGCGVQIVGRRQGLKIALLVDQLEEIWTQYKDEKGRDHFLKVLSYAAEADGPLTLLLTLRADFLGPAMKHPLLAKLLQNRQEIIRPMSADELRQVIQEPPKRFGVSLEPGLTELLVREAILEPGGLPLLEFTLSELWRTGRKGHVLTLAAYNELGGIAGALNRRADSLYSQRLSEAQRPVADRLLLALAEPSPGGGYLRLRPYLDTLRSMHMDATGAKELETVIGILAGPDARLITTTAEPAGERKAAVEVAHEALFESWDHCRTLLDQNRTFLEWRRQFRVHVSEWLRLGRDRACLVRGRLLKDAKQQAKSRSADLQLEEREFIRRSSVASWQRVAVLVLLLAAIPLSGAAVYYWIQRNAPDPLLAASSRYRTEDPSLARLLAYQADLRRPSNRTLEALLSSMATAPPQLEGHLEPVSTVRFNVEGSRIASGAVDGSALVWSANLQEHGERTYQTEGGLELGDPVVAVGFGPGNNVYALSGSGSWQSWPQKNQGSVIPQGALISAAAWNPAADQAAVGGDGGSLRLVSRTGAAQLELRLAAERITAVDFSPDGRYIAAGGSNGAWAVWEASGRKLASSEAAGGAVANIAFLPAEKSGGEPRVLIARRGGAAQISRLQGQSDPLTTLAGAQAIGLGGLVQAAADLGGELMATAHANSFVAFWNISEGEPLFRVEVDSPAITALAFAPDARRLAIGRRDGTVRILDLDRRFLYQHVKIVLRQDKRFPFAEECRKFVGSCRELE